MRRRVLCDTNVLVSAFIAAGPPSRVIEEAVDGRFELILAEPVMIELKRILSEKLDFEQERWHQVEGLMYELATKLASSPVKQPDAVTGHPDDDLILACALTARVDVLVSGDRKHRPQSVLTKASGSSPPKNFWRSFVVLSSGAF